MEPGQVQISELKYRELQIKSRGFDVVRELEALQTKINQLQLEKNLVVKSLKDLYDYAESIKLNQQTPPIINDSENTTSLEDKQPSDNLTNNIDDSTIDNTDSRKIIEKKITRTRSENETK